MNDDDIETPDAGLPNDEAAELSVLGAMLLSPRAIDDALDAGVTARDFYRPAHELIFLAIVRLASRGEPADPVTTVRELERAGDLARAGGPLALHRAMERLPQTASASYYARIVADKGKARRLVMAGEKIAQLGRSGTDGQGAGDVDDLLAAAEAELAGVGDQSASGDAVNFGDRIDAIIDALDEPIDDNTAGITTGFLDLDQALRPAKPGQMIVVAARPRIGKSTFIRDWGRHAAFDLGKRVLIHTLEESREEAELKLVAAEGRVQLQRLQDHTADLNDIQRIGKARSRIDGATLIIDGAPGLTLARLRASIRKHRPDVAYVDQLQLMTPTSTRKRGADSRQEEVGALSRGIKLIAKAEGIPIVVCSKLNRGPESRPNKIPELQDLRDSGEIESDADTVLLLHREDAYEAESPRAGEVDVIIAKQRAGRAPATETLVSQLHYARFYDIARSEQRATTPGDFSADAIQQRTGAA